CSGWRNRRHTATGGSSMTEMADPIEVELFGSDECRYRGITTRGQAPALAMCRALLGSGFDPHRPLHVYRGNVLALKVRTIGEGAQLTVSDAHGRPRLRRMLQQAQGCDLAASPHLVPDAAETPIDEPTTDESEAV